MSHLYSNHPQWWNSNNDHKISESLSKGLSLRVDSPPQLHLNAMPLGFQLHSHLQDSSSSQSTQSNPDLTGTAAAGGSHSQDLCLSSESGQEVSGGSNFVGMKSVYMMGHPDTSCNTTQTNYGRTTTCTPHLGSDPYFNGYLTAYGPTPVIQNQMMGVTAARVPLPLDVCEDEPIYVNAKQYHGILRRRQSRAKLEAQNKLIRARKPYLHESRHRHALNRVRGTGGRFLSKKELQQHSNSSVDHGNHSSSRPNQFGYDNVSPLGYESYHHQSQCVESGTSTMSSSSGYYQPSDGGFLGISSGGTMQRNGRVYG